MGSRSGGTDLRNLLVFGAGYSARACAREAEGRYDRITGTTRSQSNFGALREAGMEPVIFDGTVSGEIEPRIASAGHLLVSIAPDADGDPVLRAARDRIEAAPGLDWICYLSTIGVYGDHGGAVIDENTPLGPSSRRSVARLDAEEAWLELGRRKGIPVAIFRLSGIYGPGRNTFVNLAEGKARRLVKPGQVFNRIHCSDIARAFLLAAEKGAGGIFNITDDEPAPPQDVVAFAASLMGIEPPPEQDFATAELTPMARSFYGENKRVSNARSKAVLGMEYAYPDYRTALTRMWREDDWR